MVHTMATKATRRTGSSNRKWTNRDSIPVGPPIAPAIISRVPTFQPTFRRADPRGMDETWQTPWGTVRVAGAPHGDAPESFGRDFCRQ